MSRTDWEEVKRLAADFQRAQLSSAIQRLSERNCIEIVNKLVEEKVIDVIHTNDGKEYLTHAQLTREIRDELIVAGGRINLVDLQQLLNVDFSHIETKANEIIKADKSLNLVLGQLIDRDYLHTLAEEINDKLQESGQVTIGELTKQYDLPGEYISEVIEERLGSTIQGQMHEYDRGVIFTESFVARQSSMIRGVCTAITRPTPVINLMNQFKFQEKLFYTILEALIKDGRLKGDIVGGRQDKATYVPDIYARTQNHWIDSFYQQNGYLEYDALTRLGIPDSKQFVKRRYKSQDLIYLQTVCVGQTIRDQVEASIEEALSNGIWIDITPILPSPFTETDANQLLQHLMKGKTEASVFCDSIVASQKFINSCKTPFDDLMKVKAESDAKNAATLLLEEKEPVSSGGDSKKDRRDERKKRAQAGSGSTHSGGGGNAREVKTKKSKKGKGRGGDDDDFDTETSTQAPKGKQKDLNFMTAREIESVLEGSLHDCPEEFISEIAAQLHRPLTRAYQEVAKSIFLESSGAGGPSDRRKTHSNLQEKVNGLWTNIRLFEKAIRVVGGKKSCMEDLATQLSKYLLKTLCSDVTNLLFEAVANDHMITVADTDITPEMRTKLLVKFPDNLSKILSRLHNSLTGKTFEEFVEHFEDAATLCDVMLKKTDKKKERQLIFNHRQVLSEQIRKEQEPAMALHLATVLMFQTYTNCMVHCPGKCIPQLITYLYDYLPTEQHAKLHNYQGLVQKQLSFAKEKQEESEDKENEEKADSETNTDEGITAQLNDLLPSIREIALAKRVMPANGE